MSKLPALIPFTRRPFIQDSGFIRKSFWIALALIVHTPIAIAILNRAAAMLT